MKSLNYNKHHSYLKLQNAMDYDLKNVYTTLFHVEGILETKALYDNKILHKLVYRLQTIQAASVGRQGSHSVVVA